MNQFSLNSQHSNTLWYTSTPPPHTQIMEHSQHKHYPSFNNYNNNNNDDDKNVDKITTPPLDKEHMFEKPLTPSDVGKLNRLVIPKQHAEKYLPLASTTSTASATVDGGGSGGGGGILLGFEDELGKCWKFRYSYWNSSQSYVLTKGWSRYVKDKKLDAGDVVLFDRHRFEQDRFFIGWRRRGSNAPVQDNSNCWTGRSNYNYNFNNYGNQVQQNVMQSSQLSYNYGVPQQIPMFSNFPTEPIHQGSVQVRQKEKISGNGNSKSVRLFGVNLECQLEQETDIKDEPEVSDGSSLSSQGQGLGSDLGLGSTMGPSSYYHFDYVGYSPNHHNHNHMDMNF